LLHFLETLFARLQGVGRKAAFLPILALVVAGCQTMPAVKKAAAEGTLSQGAVTTLADAQGIAASAGKAISGAGRSQVGIYLAGLHAKKIGDYEAAAKIFSGLRIEDLPYGAGLACQNILQALIAAGDMDQVRKSLGKMPYAKDRPLSALVTVEQALKNGRFVEAREAVAKLPKDGIGVFASPLIRAWIAYAISGGDAALKVLRELERVRGGEMVLAMQRSLIFDLAMHPAEARARMQAAVDMREDVPLRLAELYGNLLERQGDKAAAQALYQRLAAQAGGINQAVGEALLARLATARQVQPMVAGPAEGVAEVLMELAILLRQGDADIDALVFAQLALDLDPTLDVARMLLGDMARNGQRYAVAAALYQSVPRQSLYRWSAQLSTAETLHAAGKTDDAIDLLRKLIDAEPKRTDAAIALGDFLRADDRLDAAAEAYKTAIDRIPAPGTQDWSVFYRRGMVLERAKHWPLAEKDFLKALSLSPDQPYVLNYLAYSWIERGENLDKALQMLETAVAARPEDGFIIDSLGWAHYRRGDFDKAVSYLERAVELSPSDAVLNDHLGDVYWKVGRINEARFQWSRALGLKPEPAVAESLRHKLRLGLDAAVPGNAD